MVLLGILLAFCLLLSAGAAMVVTGEVSPELIIQQTLKGIDSFPILAIPIFFFAGDLMNKGNVSEHLIRVARHSSP